MTHFKRAVLYLAAGMLIAVAARQADGEDPLAQTARGGVIVKQADIVGQVFIASERPGRRDEPAGRQACHHGGAALGRHLPHRPALATTRHR